MRKTFICGVDILVVLGVSDAFFGQKMLPGCAPVTYDSLVHGCIAPSQGYGGIMHGHAALS